MHRQDGLPFSTTPERVITDTNEIELHNMADLDLPLTPDEAPSPPTTQYYAIYYAMEPFIAAADAVRESIDDAEIYDHPQSLCEYLSNAGEYAQTALAAPVAYGSAAVVSVCGFFGGAARDIYETACYYLTTENENTSQTTNTPSP